MRIRPEDIEVARKNYPDAKILTHPECHREVCKLSDFVGSTKEIMEFAKSSKDKQFVIATEKGVVDRLSRDSKSYNWGKEFILIKDDIYCQNMKWNSMEDIYNSLKYEQHEVTVESNVFEGAKKCVEKMFEALKTGSVR